MALRLRYEIDTPRRLRDHVHFVDGAGYFFYPGAVAAKGTLAVVEVTFTASDHTALLRGWIWARPSSGGIWLELNGAKDCLDRLEQSPPRSEVRVASDQLVLLEGAGLPAILCRLREVSGGGVRLAAMPADAGAPGQRVKVTLPEAGPAGGQLEAFGRVSWTGDGEVGVEWIRGDLASRAAVRRMVQIAEEEWEGARTAAHSRTCRCMKERTALPEVMLLG
jgi:hypothetical protein